VDSFSFDNAKRALYTLAHAIAENGLEQSRLVREMRDTEVNALHSGKLNDQIVTELTRMLLNEMELREREKY
jgi:hypothetical protein